MTSEITRASSSGPKVDIRPGRGRSRCDAGSPGRSSTVYLLDRGRSTPAGRNRKQDGSLSNYNRGSDRSNQEIRHRRTRRSHAWHRTRPCWRLRHSALLGAGSPSQPVPWWRPGVSCGLARTARRDPGGAARRGRSRRGRHGDVARAGLPARALGQRLVREPSRGTSRPRGEGRRGPPLRAAGAGRIGLDGVQVLPTADLRLTLFATTRSSSTGKRSPSTETMSSTTRSPAGSDVPRRVRRSRAERLPHDPGRVPRRVDPPGPRRIGACLPEEIGVFDQSVSSSLTLPTVAGEVDRSYNMFFPYVGVLVEGPIGAPSAREVKVAGMEAWTGDAPRRGPPRELPVHRRGRNQGVGDDQGSRERRSAGATTVAAAGRMTSGSGPSRTDPSADPRGAAGRVF